MQDADVVLNTTEAPIAKVVCLFGGKRPFNAAVKRLLNQKDVPVLSFSSVAGIAAADLSDRPIILVVDVETLPEDLSLQALYEEVKRLQEIPPDLVCLLPKGNLALQLQVRRMGAIAYYEQPVSPEKLSEWLGERSGPGLVEPYRVLVVDDNPEEVEFIEQALTEAGMMMVQSLEDPFQILDAFAAFQADLLVVNQQMRAMTGLELIELIRDQGENVYTPVILLLSEPCSPQEKQLIQRSGDEVLCKPLNPQQLVDKVKECIQIARVRQGRHQHRKDQDTLSGLYNRVVFLKHLNRALSEEGIQELGNGVLFIALDNVKSVIKHLGRGCCDYLTKFLGNRIQECLAPSDIAGRIGDFSFGVLARRSEEKTLMTLAERIRESIAAQDEIGQPGTLSVSIGIGLFYPLADDALTMISRAKKGCGKAQARGGNRVTAYERAVPSTQAPERNEALAAMISNALYANDLELMYQPIVPMRSQSRKGKYEVSVRLRAPDGEYIPPLYFIPVAQRYELLPALDRWVLSHALDRLRQELKQSPGSQGLQFFIHQTLETTQKEDWISWFREQILLRDLIKMRPVLQFRLRDVLKHPKAAAQTFRALEKLRIKICLIQFDGRAQSIALLEELPITMVKLSMDLIRERDPQQIARIVHRIHRRKTFVIAAGIEHPNAMIRLSGSHVDFVQGTFLQFPSSTIDFNFQEISL